ncbi:LIM domain-binding protein 2-like isoform X1 [Lytechinus variegatus]|uniref:LIM domain-binding protein 2-like isoform X1 n=1 Tax=Lytechinus variegatus TaxID=7654 RepID=UPI001BB0F0A9|nr:LIM domain-binding protein 2-like isoform X1 [Lytechinus variegatus]
MPAPGMPVPMDGRDHGYVPRHTPFISQPDYRIYDLNKRLQQRTEESDNLWWDAFATEFFEDDATLTLCFCLEDGPKRYTIGRTLIPRYFRTVFEGGVTDLYYLLKHPKESFHNTTITLDCEQTTMVTHHGKPMFTKVCTEGRLVVEFTFDDLMRIRSWYFDIRQHRELIPRSVINIQDPTMLEQLSKNITRQGLTSCTLNYLRLCVILEPMQELMSRHKVYSLSPRDCLKATLFQKWQRIVTPPDTNRPTQKRRKRKSSQSALSTTGGNSMGMNNIGGGNSKKKSPGSFSSDGMPTRNGPGGRSKKRSRSGTPQPVPIPPWIHDSISEYDTSGHLNIQDVMVVGEPSLMGGEFGDEDERLITRLENQQADANNGMDNDEDFAGGESGGTGPGPGGPKTNNSSSGPGQGSWNSTDTKPPPGTNPPQDEKQVAASQN